MRNSYFKTTCFVWSRTSFVRVNEVTYEVATSNYSKTRARITTVPRCYLSQQSSPVCGFDSESRIDRKLTVGRFSIKFRGRERNGTRNFPGNFQRDIPPVIPVARVLSCLNSGLKFLGRSRRSVYLRDYENAEGRFEFPKPSNAGRARSVSAASRASNRR